MAANVTRDYPNVDVLDGAGAVAHLAHWGASGFGSWYSLCGRIVPSWRVPSLSDTDAGSVCRQCAGKLARVNRRR